MPQFGLGTHGRAANLRGKSTSQSGIGPQEKIYVVRVSGQDNNQLAMIARLHHAVDNLANRVTRKRVLAAEPEAICLVNEQDLAERPLKQLNHPGPSMALEHANEVRGGALNHLVGREEAHVVEDAAEDASSVRLARAQRALGEAGWA